MTSAAEAADAAEAGAAVAARALPWQKEQQRRQGGKSSSGSKSSLSTSGWYGYKPAGALNGGIARAVALPGPSSSLVRVPASATTLALPQRRQKQQ